MYLNVINNIINTAQTNVTPNKVTRMYGWLLLWEYFFMPDELFYDEHLYI